MSDRRLFPTLARASVVWLLSAVPVLGAAPGASPPDRLFHNGKVVTVDERFRIAEAFAVEDGRIVGVGTDAEVLPLAGAETRKVDLQGKTVLPGLIDSHVHPAGASMHEFDHRVPEMRDMADVLDYVRSRARALEDGEWIVVQQVFITRLREQRYPTRSELDRAAPRNPVMFRTGPDASLNSLALEESGIDRDFEVDDDGPGHVEKDPETGEPTGILRGCTRFADVRRSGESPTAGDRLRRLEKLLRDYNAAGITSIADRSASSSAIDRYATLLEDGDLSVRVFCSAYVDAQQDMDAIRRRIGEIAGHPLCRKSLPRDERSRLRIGGIKVFLDGGMLTGSAYMREPWGVSEIYSIDDPEYRGVLFVPKEKLRSIVEASFEKGLQFTAHSVGDGAVHTLLEVYEELADGHRYDDLRPCITHSNFMSLEAVETMERLGVVADIQPAWLYLDAWTLVRQFGLDRLRYFQPLRTIFEHGVVAGGGSDHMQKIGARRSVNPYDPFLGMWIAITRSPRWYDGRLHPEEALTREQAIRFYTSNNAYLLFQEGDTGSLTEGKAADFIVIDRDVLSCPVDEIRDTEVLETWVAGERVFERP